MPVPLTPFVTAGLRLLGRSAVTGVAGLGGSKLASAFSHRGDIDLKELGRRLGTPNPSAAQVNAERSRLSREQMSESFNTLTGNVKRAAIAMGLLGALAPAVIGITKAFHDFSVRVLERQRKFDFLSPGIAAAFARLDYQTLRLNARTAAGTTQTTTTLANAVMRMQESGQPLREATTNLRNVMGTFSAMIAQALMDFANRQGWPATLDSVARAADLIARGGLRNQLSGEDYREFLRSMQRGSFGNPINQRPGRDRL